MKNEGYRNCMDDRNQLLERCLISEKLLESMKSQNVELKRRYEDAQSALQELGREHQELQVDIFVCFIFPSWRIVY